MGLRLFRYGLASLLLGGIYTAGLCLVACQ
jgi:hypothetical protein